MLQRLNVQVQRQDFCNPHSDIWPPEEAVQIIIGKRGQSCKDVCEEKSKDTGVEIARIIELSN